MLNGFVFLIFGAELPSILSPAIKQTIYSNVQLLVIVVFLTMVLFLTRFVFITTFYAYRSFKFRKHLKKYWHDILLLTFSGVKGSVSIATILLLPKLPSKQYSIILFIVGSVSLLSFMIGLFMIPRLAPNHSEVVDNILKISIFSQVLDTLQNDSYDQSTKATYYAVMDNYNTRIKSLILEQESNQVKKDLAELQLWMIGIESDGLENAFAQKQIDIKEYRIYQQYIKLLERQVNRSFTSSFSYSFIILGRVIRGVFHELYTFKNLKRLWFLKNQHDLFLNEEMRDNLSNLFLDNTEVILDALEDLEGYYNATLVDFIQNERLRDADLIKSGLFVDRILANISPESTDELLWGYYLERRTIAEFEKDKRITPHEAQKMRQEVNELELFSLRDASERTARREAL